jgi:putative ABC transport system ATP-binding protein
VCGAKLLQEEKIMTDKSTPDAVCIDSLEFGWRRDAEPVLAIDHLRIGRGERIFIEGPSGSGKSTLLSLLAGVLVPRKGEVAIHGVKISRLSGAARDRLRADNIGYIFQMFNLIPYLSVIENVLLPCKFSRRRREKAGDPENAGYGTECRPAAAGGCRPRPYRQAGADHRR